MMLRAKQKGFTLLELLVVITLLAILSVGALVAYEGIGENAQATAAARSTAQTDQAIRNFRGVTQNYPDQWDNLIVASGQDDSGAAVTATGAGAAPNFANNESRTWLAALPFGANGLEPAVVDAFDRVGIEEIQTRTQLAATPNVEPNLQHNEGATAGLGVSEVVMTNLSHLAIVPTNDGTCTYATAAVTTRLSTLDEDGNVVAGTALSTTDGQNMNKINDSIESDECHLVVAFGFGHDAAHSTNGSTVAISTAPTFVSNNTNPATDYARYIALFHVAADANDNGDIEVNEVFARPRLLAIADTEGNVIDENIAAATDETAN